MRVHGRVGVNASIVGPNPPGLGLYTINLVRELDKLRDDLVVYTSAPAAFDGVRATVIAVTSAVRPDRGMRGHACRAVWLQTVQRMRSRVHGLRVVLNTVPKAILYHRIPQVTVVHDLLAAPLTPCVSAAATLLPLDRPVGPAALLSGDRRF